VTAGIVTAGIGTAGIVIAIDGPAGAGKSTVAKALAERLGASLLDTGAMYRAVTLLALRSGVDLSDGDKLAALARAMTFETGHRFILDGEDVSAAIRSPDVDAAVSEVSAHPSVRGELVRRQREWVAANRCAIVEGRDIGSVVLPDARLKVFLTADPDVRAERRSDPEVTRRDEKDSRRAASPLVIADGAIVVDSTKRSVDEVVEEVLAHL